MKAVVKKRVVSRKKQTRVTKAKSVSSKKTSNKVKPRKPVVDKKKADKQVQNKDTSLVTKKGAGKSRGAWPKGVSGNPKGRPKLGNTKFDNLLRAVRSVEAKHRVNLLEHFIERGLSSDSTLIAVMKKMYPDLKSIEQIAISIDPVGDRKRSLAIQQKLAERMRMKLAR
jgi:hypothetical protein